MSTSDILESLIEKDNGYLITSKAVESGVSKPSVSKYVREHDMEKVAHGIYILDNVWPDELFVLQQRNKNIIYSGETALYLHGLIDREYSHICFTVPTGYNATHIKKKKDVYKRQSGENGRKKYLCQRCIKCRCLWLFIIMEIS